MLSGSETPRRITLNPGGSSATSDWGAIMPDLAAEPMCGADAVHQKGNGFMKRGMIFSIPGRVGGPLLAAALAVTSGCVVRVGPPVYGYYRPAPVYYRPYYGPPAVVVAPAPVVVEPAVPMAAAQANPALQQLVAPVALYPDPILAILFPASTYPDQVFQANQFVQSNPNAAPAEIDAQNWDPSVKALAHYPTVLNYLATQPDWTRSLGSAFSENQANVFEAVQDLRAQARNNGNLNSLVYLDVVTDGPTISIQPADPASIYFPVYDPVLVYQGPYVITYGPSYFVGPWLVQGVDWGDGVVFVGDWHGGWLYGPGGWRRDPYFHGYDHRWGHDDRWGPRPFVDRSHWAVRPEMREHGGFRAVARDTARVGHIQAQNQHAQARNADIRRQQQSRTPARTEQNTGRRPEEQDQKKDEKR